MSRSFLAPALALLAAFTPRGVAAEAPRVAELRTQRVGGVTYFTVKFPAPPDMQLPARDWQHLGALANEGQRFRSAGLPRLVPQDGRTAAVYPTVWLPFSDRRDIDLEFAGQARTQGRARLLLLYPKRRSGPDGARPSLAPELAPREWAEVPVRLDFRNAEQVPTRPAQGPRPAYPSRRDLEGLWAGAQARYFVDQAALTRDSGFYSFAAEATARKYGIPSQAPPATPGETDRVGEHRRLYETTTGAAALTESLAMRRLLRADRASGTGRTVPVERLRGIDIAEHPWEKMMAGRKPAPEPLARLVPHDNYYVTFQSLRSLIEFGELLDEWGTNALRAYELTSRDQRLRQRYEKQLCLRSTALGKALGPALVRGVALTGSDPYVREGSDVSVLFHVKSRTLFLGAVEPFLKEARAEFGAELKEKREDYRGVQVESFVTPLREVSLHRAAFGEYVVYSNSGVALRRILDTHAGRRKALAESLDFQYMRTVFRRGDGDEDGFAFLSDAFIRQLVGPASKIKEKRRLEALTSLMLATHGALFAAWEAGKLPADHEALLAASGLRPEEIDVPDGRGVAWDGERRAAVSEVYNTMHFLTPLVELPIDDVTKQEQREYDDFRREYLNLWRRYFDPVGMRFALRDRRVRLETYILPLIQSSQYNALRQWAGDGTMTLDLSTISPRTLFQYVNHVAPTVWAGEAVDSMLLRFDDGPAYRGLARWYVRQELERSEPEDRERFREEMQQTLRLPLTVGAHIRDAKAFDKLFEDVRVFANHYLGPLTAEAVKPPYKGVSLTRVRFDRDGRLAEFINPEGTPKARRFVPTLFHARIDGHWYASLSPEPLRDLIDRAEARRAGKGPLGEKVEVNTSLHVAPEAAFEAAGALRAYLEWETFRRAVANAALWEPLYRGGLTDGTDAEAAALRFLGFVPVSPDGAAYRYDRRTQEVRNARHGSYRRPHLHEALDEQSPVARLLGQLRHVRADLRFREDGVHTVVTLERTGPQPRRGGSK
jgi:hypothetical protein